MGLDQTIYAVDLSTVDTVVGIYDKLVGEEIAYWRRHVRLHLWMNDLYVNAGGRPYLDPLEDMDYKLRGTMNVTESVRLTLEDVDRLMEDVRNGRMVHHKKSRRDCQRGSDLELLAHVRKALESGKIVYYMASW